MCNVTRHIMSFNIKAAIVHIKDNTRFNHMPELSRESLFCTNSDNKFVAV